MALRGKPQSGTRNCARLPGVRSCNHGNKESQREDVLRLFMMYEQTHTTTEAPKL